MKKQNEIFLSQLSPPDISNSLTKYATYISEIFNGNTRSINFNDLYYDVYMFCSFGNFGMLIDYIEEQFKDYFKDVFENFNEEIYIEEDGAKDKAKSFLERIGTIFPKFIDVANAFSDIFGIAVIMKKGKNDMYEHLHNLFLNVLGESDYITTIETSILLAFKSFLEDNIDAQELNTSVLFQKTLSSKDLIQDSSPQKIKHLSIMMEKDAIEYTMNFVNEFMVKVNSDDINLLKDDEKIITYIKEYVNDSYKLLTKQYFIASRFFNEDFANKIKNKIIIELSDYSYEIVKFCVSNINLILKNHDSETFIKFFELCSSFDLTCEAIFQNVIEQVKLESLELNSLIDAINFYQEINEKCFRLFKNYSRLLFKEIYTLVNSKSKSMMKKIIKFLSNEAKKRNPDILCLMELLSYLEQKTEFMQLYSRQVAHRLIKNTESQFDSEVQIYVQFQEITKGFDLNGLKMLINSVEQSMNLHLGPVLCIPSTVWPFKPPFPSPLALTEISKNITNKYSRLYTGRILKFPINHWVVNIKDTIDDHIYVCTGVQAEILLYFNNHEFIGETSLEPNINQEFLTPALVSMEDSSIPVLKKEEEVYKLNPDFKYDKIVKLKQPKSSSKSQENSNLDETKNNMIDCTIISQMKSNRVMNLRDIDQAVKDIVSSKFNVSSEDIHKRLETLVAREYIEYFQNDKIRYIT